MKPLVSIVTPMFNAEPYIAETIESVLSQTYENWEMIIVDNCSSDKSRNIVREYASKDDRIRLIELEFNSGGPARPRNIGLGNARGEYIAFIDSDDLWLKEKIEKQINFMTNNENIRLLYSQAFIMHDETIVKRKKPEKWTFKRGQCFKRLFLSNNFIMCCTVMLRWKGREDHIFFDESPDLITVEDFDFWLRVAREGMIDFLEEPFSIYRIHMSNFSASSLIFLKRNIRLIKAWKNRVSRCLFAEKCCLFVLYACYSLLKNSLFAILSLKKTYR
ncbi:MAG: glycosyltransferase family 2 protein [Nitrospirae bacterium]|nr:glycosyltransferase family 2 protein [Nitrospirota bacterium]